MSSPILPARLRPAQLAVPEENRNRGILWVAGSGSGKSEGLGLVAFQDFLHGTPQVLIDPVGALTDAFLTRVGTAPPRFTKRLLSRIRYVDMSGRGPTIPSWPLLYNLPGESPQDVADRFLETCRAIDPHLQSASIQGYNALYRIGAPVGIVLSSLGLQIDQALALLDAPELWQDRFAEACQRQPSAREAVDFLQRTYLSLSRQDRLALSNSYRGKIEPILLDPSMRAMFCSPQASIDFNEVVQRHQTVILDFRAETNPRKRLLKTRWAFDTLVAYIRHRGAGHHRPLSIHIDEITELTNQESLGQDLFARDLDYLFNVLQRNYGLQISAALQQLWQVSDRTRETLLSLGTQIFGVISDEPTAAYLARLYAPIDPYRIKRTRPVWMSDPALGAYIVDHEPVDFPLEEQIFLASLVFRRLRPFEFLVKPRHQTGMRLISMRRFMGRPWPSDHATRLAQVRALLSRQLDATPLPAAPTREESFDTIGDTVTDDAADISAQLDQDFWATGT